MEDICPENLENGEFHYAENVVCAIRRVFVAAQEITLMKRGEKSGYQVTPEQRKTLEQADKMSLSVLPVSPFMCYYMGKGNDIFYGAAAPDSFPTIAARLMQACVAWSIQIIQMLDNSGDMKFEKKALANLDKCVMPFKGGHHDMPHVPSVHFHNGMTKTVKGKANKSATGRYRSTLRGVHPTDVQKRSWSHRIMAKIQM